ncbi:MAG: phosphatase PAP2 family protein [Burkholderiaceae bacterium]|nr:phosphatase PAP2 family protein [Burkholderiaceae bacterium]
MHVATLWQSSAAPIGAGVAAAGLITGVFLLAPEVDLAVSGLFADGANGFPLAHDAGLYALNRAVTWLSRIALAAVLLGALVAWLAPPSASQRGLAWLRAQRRALLYLLAVAALGPGLMVNALFKDQGGRARPVNVSEFGGSKRFTRPFVFADQCARNCAFPSGHVAAATMPVTGYFLARSRRARRGWLLAGVAGGGAVGVARMLTGSHFLSDVLFAMVFVFLAAALCAAWLQPRAVEERV